MMDVRYSTISPPPSRRRAKPLGAGGVSRASGRRCGVSGRGGADRTVVGDVWRLIISLVTRLLLAAYFLEAGLVLIVAPWSAFWDRNFFVARLPQLGEFLGSPPHAGRCRASGSSRRPRDWPSSAARSNRRSHAESTAGSTVQSDH